MSSAAADAHHAWDEEARRAALAKLDNSASYSPAPDELEFLKSQTGITDEAQLKARVEDVQSRAYAVRTHVSLHFRSRWNDLLRFSHTFAYTASRSPGTCPGHLCYMLDCRRKAENLVLTG